MRRCVNEAFAAARGRIAFGHAVADFPLMRRQLMKLLVPAEQALSMALCAADALGRGAGELPVIEAEDADDAMRDRAHGYQRADGEVPGAEVGPRRSALEPLGQE